jgi:hypothetical protein
VISKEAQGPKDGAAAVRITGEDDYWIIREYNCSRLKEALGIDDNDFCEGIYQQLDNLLSIEDGTQNRRNFDFVLSVVRSLKPVDKLHATLLIQMAVVHLSAMRQSEILLKPLNYASCRVMSLWLYIALAGTQVGWKNKESESMKSGAVFLRPESRSGGSEDTATSLVMLNSRGVGNQWI